MAALRQKRPYPTNASRAVHASDAPGGHPSLAASPLSSDAKKSYTPPKWENSVAASAMAPTCHRACATHREGSKRRVLLRKMFEANNGQTVFRALYRGGLIGEAFNDGWVGKTLTEVTPPSLQSAIISASDQCAATGRAVYTILRTYDGKGFAINLERLLLPFGKDGRVQVILASLQLISLQGVVERRSIVGDFEARCESVLSITIPAASIVLRPKSVKGDQFVAT